MALLFSPTHFATTQYELLVMACLPFHPMANSPILERVSTTASPMNSQVDWWKMSVPWAKLK
ncbi:MAG: hypothetical protein ACKPKO_54970, partial [Candidatus Fonsibacter sp.]